MMIDLNDDHDLEVHTQELKRLDYYRKESARLRDEGYEILKEWNEKDIKWREKKNFISKVGDYKLDDFIDSEKPWAILEYLSLIKAFIYNPKIEFEQKKELLKANIFSTYLTLLKNINTHPVSVELATEAMQVLTMLPGTAFLEQTLLCWYWIIREIFTAERPDWSIGGARAGDKGHSNAFTTLACVDSLKSFADAYEYTGKFFGKIGEIQERLDQLKNIEQLKDQDSDFELLADWLEMEKEQILLSGQADLLQYWSHFAISIPFIERADIEKIHNQTEFDNFVSKISENLLNYIKNVRKNFKSAKKEIIKFRKKECKECKSFKNSDKISITEKDYPKIVRSESAHKNAIAIFNEAINLAKEVIKSAPKDNTQKWDWNLLQGKCNGAAERIQRILDRPVKKYLESVIDRELSDASLDINQEWEPGELICAATGYSSIINKPDKDERLSLTIPTLCKVISRSGQFPRRRSYHTIKKRISVFPKNHILLSYFARLIQRTKYLINWEIVRNILSHFEQTKDILGWGSILTSESLHYDIESTTNAVQALATINSMLDEQINNIVLEHFTVKQPEDINIPTLDHLFYSDYGIYKAFKESENKSISQTFYRIRLHITRLRLQSQDQEKLFSLILYGPPGTGKTALIESLAKTCKVPLVEVTPSDIIEEGEAFAEKRAKTVFEALSLLTRVVILFDEFDPVLRKRDPNSRDLNVFSFLTPGMLPKLKNLHEKSKKRSVAYVLATNLIGTLDEAAIRTGRFDERLGIFPPDLLSRTGRFISQAKLVEFNFKQVMTCALSYLIKSQLYRLGTFLLENYLLKNLFSSDSPFVKEVITQTAGAGMSSLICKGWFTYSNNLEKDTPLYQVFVSEQDRVNIEWPEPEEELDFKGKGRAASREYLEWKWITLWDDELRNDDTNDKTKNNETILKDALDKYPTYEILGGHIKKLEHYKVESKETQLNIPVNIKAMDESELGTFIKSCNEIVEELKKNKDS